MKSDDSSHLRTDSLRVGIRFVEPADASPFIAAVKASRELHHPWVSPPRDERRFAAYVARLNCETDFGFVIINQRDDDLIGVVNLTNVVRGAFQSGYLGYYAFQRFAGQGLMKQGLTQVVHYAFHTLRLHRLEANIQPANAASIGLARACGFRREGFSPRYLKVAGRWRDHERWAILRERRTRSK